MGDPISTSTSRRPWLRECVTSGLMIVAILAIWLYLGYLESLRLRPPKGTSTLAGLISAARPTKKLALIDPEGERHFVWIGTASRRIVPASGPPVYVFDASGKLVGQSDDIGDSNDDRMRRFFSLGLEGREVTPEEALRLIKP